MEEFERLLGKDNPILESLKNKGYKVPTEIQEKSIPEILKGRDIIAGASTGSGKTLAFSIGIVKNVKKNYGIQGLILTPTRELAEQIKKELSDFSRHKNLNIISVYGGVSIREQIRNVPKAEVVVGTPGRILDLIKRGSLNFSLVNTLVLDEADRMLDMGFRDDVEKIINHCPIKNRQTLFFSATITHDVNYLSKKYMHDKVEVSAEPLVSPEKLKQVYYNVQDNLKYSLLKHLLESEKSKLVMIFCNTRRNVDFVANSLREMGINALPIHGGFSQEKRNKIISSFHSSKVLILVATDVAARGLDIKGVSHVYNYDIPPTVKEYIHRIGRTARAEKEGKVINIIASRDYENFNNIVNSDFIIKEENTPVINRVFIKSNSSQWNGRKSSGRDNWRGRRNFSNNRFRGRGRR